MITRKQWRVQLNWPARKAVVFLYALIFPLLLFSSFVFAIHAVAGDEPREIEVNGIVTLAPPQPGGHGTWQITTYDNISYTLLANDQTEFKKGVPAVRQQVKVKGFLTAERDITATEIERLSDGENGDVRLKGLLVAAPAQTDGIGVWIIQHQTALTYTVVANQATRLDNGVPALGAWLEIRGQWQLDGSLLASRIRADEHEVSQVIVRLADGVPSTTIASEYGLVPLRTLLASANIHLFKTDDDQERALVSQLNANAAKVVWAELNYAGGIPEGHGYKTWHWGGDDPTGYVNQDAFTQVNLTAQIKVGGEGMVIAVLDTGVDLAHPALQARLLSGWDMVSDDNLPADEGDGLGWGHGTHVAGILAKIAPESMLLPVRVLDSNGRGNLFTLAYAIEWAVKQGADVINLSLGAEADSRVLHDTIQRAIAQGVIVVAAAGNANTTVPQFPASYADVIAVTAVDRANHKADFANYGVLWVDMAAPGVGITSTMVGPLGSGYASWSGTSMATAFVSGAAALVRQTMPNASSVQVAAQLQSHSQNLDGQNLDYQGQLGGLLDIKATIGETTSSTPIPTVAPGTTPSPTLTPTPAEVTTKLYLPVIK